MTNDNEMIVHELARAMRTARNSAFEAAIEICEDLAKTGGCATCCAIAIRRMQNHVDTELTAKTSAEVIAFKGTH